MAPQPKFNLQTEQKAMRERVKKFRKENPTLAARDERRDAIVLKAMYEGGIAQAESARRLANLLINSKYKVTQ